MKLSDLTPNPSNPRKISDPKLTMLKKSLDKFGDLSGIVYNRRTKRLVGGHQRVKVLPPDTVIQVVELDQPSRTGTIAEGTALIDGEQFKYREVDWDEMTEKAANIAANKHGGEFDLPLLSEWLTDLKSIDYDMDLTGFDSEELSKILGPIDFKEPDAKGDPTLKEPQLKLCPNCGVIIENG